MKLRMKAVAVLLAFVHLAAINMAQAEVQSAETIAKRLSQFIQIPTISHQAGATFDAAAFLSAQQFLQAEYPLAFASVDYQVVGDYSLLLHWKGSDASLKPGLFMAHIDVVPVETSAQQTWDYPPFAGQIADGFVYGRGALDNKNGVIAWLEALEHLLRSGFKPTRSLYFAFGHDEEIGGESGAAKIAEYFKESEQQLSFAIDEGGAIVAGSPMLSSNKELALVGVVEKGYATLSLTAEGEGGHSSMPVANSAMQRLAKAVTLLSENPMPQRLIPSMKAMIYALAEEQGTVQKLAMRNLWLSKPFLLSKLGKNRMTNAYTRTTLATTIFNAGVKDNVIPLLSR